MLREAFLIVLKTQKELSIAQMGIKYEGDFCGMTWEAHFPFIVIWDKTTDIKPHIFTGYLIARIARDCGIMKVNTICELFSFLKNVMC